MYSKFSALINARGISSYKVSKATGISQATLTAWKNGMYVPKYEKLLKIADFLGVDVNELTGRENETDSLPIIGQIACGSPILAQENIEGYAPKYHGVKADFCLYARGDSMIDARINDGDLVFIRRADMVENGEIAAVLIDDSATLKRVYYYPGEGKLVLSAENPKYEPLSFVGSELDSIKILGKAVAFVGRVM